MTILKSLDEKIDARFGGGYGFIRRRIERWFCIGFE